MHGFVVPGESHPVQLPKTDVPLGVAVRVTGVPVGNACVTQGPGLEQLNPRGELTTDPDPFPWNVKVSAGLLLPLPDPVKQTTFPVMYPVTTAPDDEIPPELLLVVTVAEIRVAPQASPVTVNMPDESTVII